jgi:hypothetical protein
MDKLNVRFDRSINAMDVKIQSLFIHSLFRLKKGEIILFFTNEYVTKSLAINYFNSLKIENKKFHFINSKVGLYIKLV